MTDLACSNSLADLAARIRAEHEATAIAMRRGVEHAMAAGTLLIEAKAQLDHGQWLPWLAEHCAMSERTAQLYMRLAKRRPELEAKAQCIADLTIQDAAKLLAAAFEVIAVDEPTFPPSPPPPSIDDLWAWYDARQNGPFWNSDFGDGYRLRLKISHQASIPFVASFLLELRAEHDDLSYARLCPFEEIVESIKALEPIASGKRAMPFSRDVDQPAAKIIELQCWAMWMAGFFLAELDHRRNLSDEQYEREWDEVHGVMMARIESDMAAARLIPKTQRHDTR
jgi:Protein of unknown function (DUF3102)